MLGLTTIVQCVNREYYFVANVGDYRFCVGFRQHFKHLTTNMSQQNILYNYQFT